MKTLNPFTTDDGSILIVGASSYLARYFLNAADGILPIHAISHGDIDTIDPARVKVLVNFACDQAYHQKPYDPAIDFDADLIRRFRGLELHYIFLSSRKVYIPKENTFESDPLSDDNFYGQNKIITEALVRKEFPDSHTILRIGNIIGPDMKPHTFIGQAIRTLTAQKQVILDVNGATRRDFLPVTDFATTLVQIINALPIGTYNIGAGFGTPVGNIAKWLTVGYGEGKVVISDDQTKDVFYLNTDKLTGVIGPLGTPDNIESTCINIGWRLKNE